jgi:HAD superfamily hydrolase (TIGR01549 family)
MVVHAHTKSLRAPRAIIFDTDNTLYAYEEPHAKATAATEAKAVRLLGADLDSVRSAFAQARAEVKQQLGASASSHSRLLYFQRGIEILGRKTQLLITLDLEQTYWRTFLAHCALFPGVRELLTNLRNRDISTAIITDLTSQIQFRKIIYFGLDDCFDYVVTSEEAGADKPDPAPFKLAIEKLGIEPQDIWMVGDSVRCDVEGARHFGMTTLLRVDRAGGNGHAQAADIVFDDFQELDRFVFSGRVAGIAA